MMNLNDTMIDSKYASLFKEVHTTPLYRFKKKMREFKNRWKLYKIEAADQRLYHEIKYNSKSSIGIIIGRIHHKYYDSNSNCSSCGSSFKTFSDDID